MNAQPTLRALQPLPFAPLAPHELSFGSRISGKPFVLTPEALGLGENTPDAAMRWLSAHAAEVRQAVKTQGAVLFRGLALGTPTQYQAALEALGYDLYRSNHGGASPRSNVTRKTFVSTEAPAPFIIALHTEFCYQTTRPGMISFFCVTPAAGWGETPLFDNHAIWSQLSPALRGRLETEGLLYRRHLFGKRSTFNFRKTWRETFQTEDKRVVEAYLQAEGMRWTWDAEDNLATELHLPASVPDPVTGRPCIGITMFNADSFVDNFRRFADRYHPVLRKGLEWFVRWEYAKEHTFLKVLHGNGDPFTAEESAEIQRVAWDNAIVFPWRTGDLVLIDNIAYGHARMNVRKPRRLIAAMADPYDVRDRVRGSSQPAEVTELAAA